MVVVMSPRQCLVFCNGSPLVSSSTSCRSDPTGGGRGGEPRDGYCWLETVGSRWWASLEPVKMHHQSLT